MGMVVAVAQRTNREVWPVAARCSRSCVGASQQGSSAVCVLRQAANVARKFKLIKEGQEKGFCLALTFEATSFNSVANRSIVSLFLVMVFTWRQYFYNKTEQ